MRIQLFLLALFANWQLPVLADYASDLNAVKADRYGINYPTTSVVGADTFTPTTHHRFGQQTGIGGSSFQTTSATAEEMPSLNYRPTSVSPALMPSVSHAGVQHLNLFSEQMTSPALNPVVTTFSTAATERYSLQQFTQSQSGLNSISLPGGGRHQPAGGSMGRQLSDPFKGL